MLRNNFYIDLIILEELLSSLTNNYRYFAEFELYYYHIIMWQLGSSFYRCIVKYRGFFVKKSIKSGSSYLIVERRTE